MISIRSSADLNRALASPIDTYLQRLLVLRREQLAGPDLSEVAHLIVVQPGDTLVAIEAEAGVPLATETHWLEWVEQHPGGWTEAAASVAGDFSVVLFVRDQTGVDPAVLALLHSLI